MIALLYRQARDLRNLRAQLADMEAAYKRMAARLQQALTQLAGHDRCLDREAALQAALAGERDKVADLEHHLELLACDNADLERVNAALMASIEWNGWRKESEA